MALQGTRLKVIILFKDYFIAHDSEKRKLFTEYSKGSIAWQSFWGDKTTHKKYLATGILLILFCAFVIAQPVEDKPPNNPFTLIWDAIHELQNQVAELFGITTGLQDQVNQTNTALQNFENQSNLKGY